MNGTSHTELLSKEKESERRVGRVGERQIREKAREGVVRQRKYSMPSFNLFWEMGRWQLWIWAGVFSSFHYLRYVWIRFLQILIKKQPPRFYCQNLSPYPFFHIICYAAEIGWLLNRTVNSRSALEGPSAGSWRNKGWFTEQLRGLKHHRLLSE